MSRLALTPTPTNYAGVAQAFTALTGYTGVSWNSSGREILVVSIGATATTLTGNIGSSVLGQAVTPFTWSPASSAVTYYGLFPSTFNEPSSGTNAIWIDFSQVVNVSVQLLQIQGVS
jgi:hypothetical protein